MRRLAFDISNDAVQLRDAHTEGTILRLPGEESVFREGFMHPLGGAALDQLQSFGRCHGGRQRWQNMNMIGHTADFDGLLLILTRNAAEKGPEPLAQSRRDYWAARFGAEHTMIVGGNV